jgi:hypothetical protein
MITLAEIPEMVADLYRGELRSIDVDGLLLELLVNHEVEDISALLPLNLSSRFHSSLRELFSGDTPLDDIFLFDSARGDHPDKEKIVAAARRWLRANDPGTKS